MVTRHRGGRRVLDMIARDPRLRMAPLAAQMVWVRLAVGLAELGEAALPGTAQAARRAEIALYAGIPPAELEAQLSGLVRLGLVSRSRDGALALLPASPHRQAEAG